MRTAFLFVLVALVAAKFEYTGKFKVVANDCVQTDEKSVTDFYVGQEPVFDEVDEAELKKYEFSLGETTLKDVNSYTKMPEERRYVLTQQKLAENAAATATPSARLIMASPLCEDLEDTEAACVPKEKCIFKALTTGGTKTCNTVTCADYSGSEAEGDTGDKDKCEMISCVWDAEGTGSALSPRCKAFACSSFNNDETKCKNDARCGWIAATTRAASECYTKAKLCSAYTDVYTCETNLGCPTDNCAYNNADRTYCTWGTACTYVAPTTGTRRNHRSVSRGYNASEDWTCVWNDYIPDGATEKNTEGKYLSCTRVSTSPSTKNRCTFTMEYSSAQTVFASIALAFVAMLFVLF